MRESGAWVFIPEFCGLVVVCGRPDANTIAISQLQDCNNEMINLCPRNLAIDLIGMKINGVSLAWEGPLIG